MFWTPSNATMVALGFAETHGLGLWTHHKKPLMLVDTNSHVMIVSTFKSKKKMNDSGIEEAVAAYRHAAARRSLIKVGFPHEALDLLDSVVALDGFNIIICAEVEQLRQSRVAQAEAIVLTHIENHAADAAADCC